MALGRRTSLDSSPDALRMPSGSWMSRSSGGPGWLKRAVDQVLHVAREGGEHADAALVRGEFDELGDETILQTEMAIALRRLALALALQRTCYGSNVSERYVLWCKTCLSTRA